MVLRKSFYIRWSVGRSPRVHEVNPGRDPSGIFRSVPKTGTEHVMKNSGLCTGLFRPELPESGWYTYSGRNRVIDFSVLEFICLFCIFLY